MTDLDDALEEPVSLPELAAELRLALAPIRELDLSTPETRAAAVQVRGLLAEIADQASLRVVTIDTALKRYMIDRGTNTMFWEREDHKGKVVYDPPRNEYVFKQHEEFRKALASFVDEGLLTESELDEAIAPILTYRCDNTRLNALSRRSDRLKATIDAYRSVREVSLLNGRVRYAPA